MAPARSRVSQKANITKDESETLVIFLITRKNIPHKNLSMEKYWMQGRASSKNRVFHLFSNYHRPDTIQPTETVSTSDADENLFFRQTNLKLTIGVFR